MTPAPEPPLRVVYLAGSGHTGSTLLAMFLDAHPRIVSVGETSFKRDIQRRGLNRLACSCGDSVKDCAFWQKVFHGVSASGFELSTLEWSNDFRYKNPIAHRLLTRYSARPFRRMLLRSVSAALPGYQARLARVRSVNVEFIRTVLDVAGADVFFDTSKRAFRLHHMLQMPQLDVKVVKLVRDVRGYVSSAIKRGSSLPDAARTWRRDQENIESITAGLPENRVMLLRYEDVCRDPRTWLARTYGFCGVPAIEPPEFVVSREHHVLGNSMRLSGQIRIRIDESWRSVLSSDDQARALEIAGPHHVKLGYAA
jgi:sulfotransferase family protein